MYLVHLYILFLHTKAFVEETRHFSFCKPHGFITANSAASTDIVTKAIADQG